jgi:2-(1,2-epoxy-1,2-dihydrophenyl)acetyl-CoA isomerase
MGEFVLTQIDIPIASITLNRASRHNSLVPTLLEELLRSLNTIETDPDIRVITFQANGRTFSTGGDLRGFIDHIDTIEDYASELVGKLNEVILKMCSMPMPFITAVHGLVTGGSLGFLLASDIVLMAPEASITPYYSVVGFSPDGGWTAMLPQIIGSKRAAEIIMLNQTITADQTLSWGLASRIVHANEIRDELQRLALEVAGNQAGSIFNTKRLINDNEGNLEKRLEAERIRFCEQISKPETQQSLAAFIKQMKVKD